VSTDRFVIYPNADGNVEVVAEIPDRKAINLALAQLKGNKLKRKYFGDLRQRSIGILLELSFIGRLVERHGNELVEAYPTGRNCDLVVHIDGGYEVEVKLIRPTKWSLDFEEACEAARRGLEMIDASWTGHVRVRETDTNLPRSKNEAGDVVLEFDVLVQQIVSEASMILPTLPKAESPLEDKKVKGDLVDVIPAATLLVHPGQSILTVRPNDDPVLKKCVGHLRREGKSSQFRGDLPSVAVFIMEGDPIAADRLTDEGDLADKIFAAVADVDGIVGMSYPTQSPVRLAVRGRDGGKPVIEERRMERFVKLIAVGMGWPDSWREYFESEEWKAEVRRGLGADALGEIADEES